MLNSRSYAGLPLHTFMTHEQIHITVFSIQVKVFWVVTLISVVVEHQHFRGPCCLYLQVEMTGDNQLTD